MARSTDVVMPANVEAGRGGGAQRAQRRRRARPLIGTSTTASSSRPAAPTGSGSGSESRGLGRMPCDRAMGTPARAKVRCIARDVSRCDR